MPRLVHCTPRLRKHACGRAFVEIDGTRHYLGAWGAADTRRAYDAFIARWLAQGRRLAPVEVPAASAITVAGLAAEFWTFAETHYRHKDGTSTNELGCYRYALRPLVELYGPTPARDFGPLGLRAVREKMIASGLSRPTVNVNTYRRAAHLQVGRRARTGARHRVRCPPLRRGPGGRTNHGTGTRTHRPGG